MDGSISEADFLIKDVRKRSQNNEWPEVSRALDALDSLHEESKHQPLKELSTILPTICVSIQEKCSQKDFSNLFRGLEALKTAHRIFLYIDRHAKEATRERRRSMPPWSRLEKILDFLSGKADEILEDGDEEQLLHHRVWTTIQRDLVRLPEVLKAEPTEGTLQAINILSTICSCVQEDYESRLWRSVDSGVRFVSRMCDTMMMLIGSANAKTIVSQFVEEVRRVLEEKRWLEAYNCLADFFAGRPNIIKCTEASIDSEQASSVMSVICALLQEYALQSNWPEVRSLRQWYCRINKRNAMTEAAYAFVPMEVSFAMLRHRISQGLWRDALDDVEGLVQTFEITKALKDSRDISTTITVLSAMLQADDDKRVVEQITTILMGLYRLLNRSDAKKTTMSMVCEKLRSETDYVDWPDLHQDFERLLNKTRFLGGEPLDVAQASTLNSLICAKLQRSFHIKKWADVDEAGKCLSSMQKISKSEIAPEQASALRSALCSTLLDMFEKQDWPNLREACVCLTKITQVQINAQKSAEASALMSGISIKLQQIITAHEWVDVHEASICMLRIQQLMKVTPQALDLFSMICAKPCNSTDCRHLLESALAIMGTQPRFHDKVSTQWLQTTLMRDPA